VLLTAIFLTGCATADQRIAAAARTKAEAGLVQTAIEAARHVPGIPDDCRTRERSGVAMGDRLDVALLKTDRALGRANARVERCAAWHDQFKTGD
jgi:hypothetical protein